MEITVGSWRIAVEQVTPTVEELSQAYDIAAPRWHQSIRRMGFIRAYQSIFEQLQANGRFSPTEAPFSLLDTGIGTGGLSQAFLNVHRAPTQLTGIDISQHMLAQTKENLRPYSAQYTMLQQDIQHLSLPDNHFDLVMGAHVLEHLPDMAQGLKEMVRVAKPGAPILLIITRRSIASAWLHLFWQIKTITRNALPNLLANAGLQQMTRLHFKASIWCNWMSLAVVGYKPM